MAKNAGCKVLGTCSSDDKVEFLKVGMNFTWINTRVGRLGSQNVILEYLGGTPSSV